MGHMTNDSDLALDCATCVAANTTACGDCVVNHLIANDAGPIEFIPSIAARPVAVAPSAVDRAAALFVGAGLVEAEPAWVPYDEFESLGSPQLA